MKIKSTKQFWWRINHLKRNGGEITVTDRTSEMDVNAFNKISLAVNRRVRWELGSEGFAIWNACGYKDIPTLAKAYGIKREKIRIVLTMLPEFDIMDLQTEKRNFLELK